MLVQVHRLNKFDCARQIVWQEMQLLWVKAILLVCIQVGGSEHNSRFLGTGARAHDKTNYCDKAWECGPFKHFMCEYKKNSKTNKCPKIVVNIRNQERMEVVKLVNEFRNTLAGGEDSAFPNGAQNIQQITWDYTLEGFAEVYGSQCGNNKVPDLDPCARTKDFQQTGGTRPLWGTIQNGLDDVVIGPEGWTSDVPDPDIIKSFESVDGQDRLVPNYGSFTMLAWATTNKMGCSIIECTCGQQSKSYKKLVCFFGPSGNIGGEKVFVEGESCKSCAAGTSCNPKSLWSKLCARKGDPANIQHIFGSATSIYPTYMLYLNLLTAILRLTKN